MVKMMLGIKKMMHQPRLNQNAFYRDRESMHKHSYKELKKRKAIYNSLILKLVPPLRLLVYLSQSNQLGCRRSWQHLILTRDSTMFAHRRFSTESTEPATGPQRPTCCVIWGRMHKWVTVQKGHFNYFNRDLNRIYRDVGPFGKSIEVTQLTVQKLSALLRLKERERESDSKFHTFSPCFIVGSHEESAN